MKTYQEIFKSVSDRAVLQEMPDECAHTDTHCMTLTFSVSVVVSREAKADFYKSDAQIKESLQHALTNTILDLVCGQKGASCQ